MWPLWLGALAGAPPGGLVEALAGDEVLPVHLERVTRGLVGAPYARSPLGEGAPPDADPRFRLDAFDCTTFVETALALAAARDLDGAARALDHVRYGARAPSFANRRHLVDTQWVPALLGEGWLEDATAEVGGDATAVIELDLGPERWARRRVARDLTLDEVPAGRVRIPVLSPAEVLARAAQIPPGTVINVVRADVPWSPVVVTHQGLVLRRGAWLFVRHASPVLKRVVDEPLDRMMRRYQKPRKWPIVGLQLLRVRDRRPVTARATAPISPP